MNTTIAHSATLSPTPLKCAGLPTAQEVERQETIGRVGVTAQKALGGIDLAAPFPLDSRTLRMDSLRGLRLSADGKSLVLYGNAPEPPVGVITTADGYAVDCTQQNHPECPNAEQTAPHGVNPTDVLALLSSLERTHGRTPSFTLLPDADSARVINEALSKAAEALDNRRGFRPNQTGKLLYGQDVWQFLRINNPASFPMQAILSDSDLANSHAAQVMMKADLLLKSIAFGGSQSGDPTFYLEQAVEKARQGRGSSGMEAFRLWFEADPERFRINAHQDQNGATVWDIQPAIRVSCRPIQFGSGGGSVDQSQECDPASLAAWYADHLNQNLDQLAQQTPIIKELKEFYKASALAQLLYRQGLRSSDLESVRPETIENSPWPTPVSVGFMPVLHLSRPDNQGRIGLYLGIGGGVIDLNIPFERVIRQSQAQPGRFYSYEPRAPLDGFIEPATNMAVRAAKFDLSGLNPSRIFEDSRPSSLAVPLRRAPGTEILPEVMAVSPPRAPGTQFGHNDPSAAPENSMTSRLPWPLQKSWSWAAIAGAVSTAALFRSPLKGSLAGAAAGLAAAAFIEQQGGLDKNIAAKAGAVTAGAIIGMSAAHYLAGGRVFRGGAVGAIAVLSAVVAAELLK